MARQTDGTTANGSGAMRAVRVSILAWLVGVLGIVGSAYAQDNRATITGTVTDPAGGALPGVTVEAKNAGTGVPYATVSNQAGVYAIPLVPAGTYSVTATLQGFQTAVRESLDVQSGQRIVVDFTLKLGSLTEVVNVTDQAPLLETGTAARGTILSTEQVANLPINGRTTMLFATLAAGVQYTQERPSTSNRPFDNGLIEGISINGGRGARNNFLLNGISNTVQEQAGQYASLALSPPPDAVSEVRVQTNDFAAEFGHTSGGTINVSLKSGANTRHGAAYYYYQDTKLRANTYTNKQAGRAIDPFHWKEPGFELDGPVVKNKTFFMFSMEHISDWIPAPGNFKVPTDLERAGDFSQTRVNGQLITLYDPLRVVNGVRQPIPGNNLNNIGRPLDPVALALLQYIPRANMEPDASGNNFYPGPNQQTDKYNVYTTQVDQVLSPKNRLSATYGFSRRDQRTGDAGITEQASTGTFLVRRNIVTGATWTSVLSSSTVVNVRSGYARHDFLWDPMARQFGAAGLTASGFPGSFTNALQLPMFPQLGFSGNYATIGGSTQFGGYSDNRSGTFTASGSITRVVSRHSLKFGGEYNAILNNRISLGTPTFTFSPVFTQQNPTVAVATQGNAFADFLLGYPGVPTGTQVNFGVPTNFSPHLRNDYYAVYAQDDWRVNTKLTLNLGLRWDLETPPTEASNSMNNGFDRSVTYTVNGVGMTGGLKFVSADNRTPFAKDFNNVQPRVGAAYRVAERTVARGGVALFYLPAYGDQGYFNGYSNLTQFNQSIDGNVTPASTLSNPFPTGLVTPVGNSQGPATLIGTGGINFSVNRRPVPYVWQFTVGAQHQLPGNFLVDVSYVGSRTRALGVNSNINYLSTADLARGAAFLNARVNNPYAKAVPSGSLGAAATTTNQQLLLPFPQFFGSLTAQNIPIGHTEYNALQVRFERRFANSFSAAVNMTASTNYEAVGFLNPQDADPDHTLDPQNYSANRLLRQVTADDTPFKTRFNGTYQVPSLSGGNAILRNLAGGWQVNIVATVQVGTPIAAPGSAFSTGVDPAVAHPTADHYFNTCYLDLSGVQQNCANDSQPAWIQQPAFTLNTLATRMSTVRLSKPPTMDLSLAKSFGFVGRAKIQARIEMFNITNVTYLGAPNTTLTNTAFGKQTTSQVNDPRTVQVALRVQF